MAILVLDGVPSVTLHFNGTFITVMFIASFRCNINPYLTSRA